MSPKVGNAPLVWRFHLSCTRSTGLKSIYHQTRLLFAVRLQKDPRFRYKLVFLEVTQNEVVNFHNMHFWEDKHSV